MRFSPNLAAHCPALSDESQATTLQIYRQLHHLPIYRVFSRKRVKKACGNCRVTKSPYGCISQFYSWNFYADTAFRCGKKPGLRRRFLGPKNHKKQMASTSACAVTFTGHRTADNQPVFLASGSSPCPSMCFYWFSSEHCSMQAGMRWSNPARTNHLMPH